jgi:CRISPR-associated protein Csx10
MGYIRVKANVKGAVTIAGSQIVGNNVESAPYISGSTLRGALASIWLKSRDTDNDFLNLFCRGDITFYGLFPVPTGIDGGDFYAKSYDNPSDYFPYRMPLSVFSCKYNPGAGNGGHGYVDASREEFEKDACPDCGAPLKQVKAPDFYYWKGTPKKRATAIEQKKELYLYHGAERKVKRAKDAALYGYTSISDKEGFIGWLYGKNDHLSHFLSLLFPEKTTKRDELGRPIFRLYMGRGKKRRGYLEVTMDDPQEGAGFIPPFQWNGNRVVAVLQTPAILYDKWFGARTGIESTDIFGDLAADKNICINDGGVFSRMILIEGWSGIHRLPRKPDQAIAPGSTFVFTIMSDLDEEKKKHIEKRLNEVQECGIGERRNEGYGRVLFNPPLNRNGG